MALLSGTSKLTALPDLAFITYLVESNLSFLLCSYFLDTFLERDGLGAKIDWNALTQNLRQHFAEG